MKGKKIYQLNKFEFLLGIIQIIFWWPVQFCAGIIVDILGLFIVPFVIRDAKIDTAVKPVHWTYTDKDGELHTGTWWLLTVALSHWAWLWSNDRDGLLGDKRGWYATEVAKGHPEEFRHKYWWAAIRNPGNNLRFVEWNSCYIPSCDFETYGSNPSASNEPKGKGWQFTIAKKIKGYRFYFGFTAWIPYSFWKGRGLLIKLGNKINGESEEANYGPEKVNPKTRWERLEFFKGCAFYANPFQDE